MKPKKLEFHIYSRKPFAEEAPVMAAVDQARKQIGQVQGSAIFRITSHVSAEPTVIPRAVDIIRGGMETAVQNAMHKGYVQGVLDGIHNAARGVPGLKLRGGAPGLAERRSGVGNAQKEVTASLERLGIR